MKFKVNDRVKILPSATETGVLNSEVGKIGIVIATHDFTDGSQILLVQMLNLCRGKYQKWTISSRYIDIATKIGEQLLFDF